MPKSTFLKKVRFFTLAEKTRYFWDHAEQRHKIAHDYIIANYVCTSGKHYPLEFYRFIKKK
ncbi:MAG: hypothetical protein DRP52_06600, partial [Planctomycetota bacterium]